VDIPPSPPQKNVMLWYSSISNVWNRPYIHIFWKLRSA